MDYKNTENWILSRVPIFQNKGKVAYNPGLKNVSEFIKELNLPNNQLKFIHIGGTNGKGSTSSYVSSILQESGYKVGIFSSPHFYDFRERIKINNTKIEKSFIINFIKKNKKLIKRLGLSFFELSFGLCLDYFNKKKIDYAVIEVGLGGRLDATNIINPLISVITNISFDHTDILGNSLKMIAKEKAGIIKKNSIVIIGERDVETDEIFINKARQHSSSIIFVSDNYSQTIYSDIDYLNKNINTAIEVCNSLNLKNINLNSILNGIKNISINTHFFGRWTILNNDPKIIFDSAHNEAGFKSVADQLSKSFYNNIYILLSFVKGKKIKKLISYLPSESKVYYTSFKNNRSMNYKEIKSNIGGNIIFGDDPKKILNNIKKKALKGDIVLITGTNFIAKELFHEN
ncbi:MAG: Folylpolyglutamate synthase [Flavobacteriales bacterium]|nr:MAG: Folylpolyglutamate synthase [Flavobacteriales bacterium]